MKKLKLVLIRIKYYKLKDENAKRMLFGESDRRF